MPIREVTSDKKRYLDLLLLADEQEDMIDRYLERGAMFLLEFDGETVGECVVTDEGDRLLELRSLAVAPAWQGRGFGRALVAYVERRFAATHDVLQAGTGGVPSTVGFYERCGFVRSHRVKDFFTRHYDHPIVEDGVLLADMVYLRKAVGPRSRAELVLATSRPAAVRFARPGAAGPAPPRSSRSRVRTSPPPRRISCSSASCPAWVWRRARACWTSGAGRAACWRIAPRRGLLAR